MENMGQLFVIVMSFYIKYKDSYDFIMNLIDDSVMGSDMSRIQNRVSSYQSLRMTDTCSWVIHEFMIYLLIFFE